MAAALYPLGKQAFLSGSINIPTDTIKCALVDTGVYTYSAAHQFFSSITGIVAAGVNMTTKTVALGVFDADDTVFLSVSGVSAECVVIYKDTGTGSTSPLIAFIDGISVVPSGGDIVIVWDNGANRIFAL
jgi:hypothetical protein